MAFCSLSASRTAVRAASRSELVWHGWFPKSTRLEALSPSAYRVTVNVPMASGGNTVCSNVTLTATDLVGNSGVATLEACKVSVINSSGLYDAELTNCQNGR